MQFVDQSFKVLTPKAEYDDFTLRTERIGRVCYKSEEKMADFTDVIFVRKLIKSGHEAMLEHCNLTIHFITDRATANAIVRHRHCGFAQESTHYINYKKKDQLTFVKQEEIDNAQTFTDACNLIETIYYGSSEKTKVRRALLPLTLKTEIIVTTNLREWRHILKLRTTMKAHPQMRALMRGVLDWFKVNLSVFVEGISTEV